MMEECLCDYHSNVLNAVDYTPSHHQHKRPSHAHLWTFVAVLTAFLVLATSPIGCNAQCDEQAGCFPPIGNLAIGRTLNTSSTCSSGTEYCILLTPNCFTCSPNTTNAPSNINDNDESTVWVSTIGSPSLPTVIQLDFEAEFLFDNTTIVFYSAEPQTMVLERSRDYGVTWEAYRYYSTQCLAMFGLEETVFVSDDDEFDSVDPICTSTESPFVSPSGGTVKFSTTQHISPNITREAATQYQTVTNIRIRLLEVSNFLEFNGDSYVYFAISEWYVNGQCKCNGHSGRCRPQQEEEIIPDKVYSGCDCEHNTAGDSCERCATGFNNVPWREGTETAANICQECVCNEHAMDCEYIPTLSSAVCINCTNNTAGARCDTCHPGYFQDMGRLLNDPNICIACGCSELGATSNLCDSQGQCSCKSNVDPESLKCTQCLSGYWNLTLDNNDGCQACDCAVNSTMLSSDDFPLCDQRTGECMCNSNAEGRRCDQCRPGFYDPSSGCSDCECNLGGSESPVCDQSPPEAQCPCKANVTSITCSTPESGFYFKLLDSIVFEAEESLFSQQTGVILPLEGTTAPFTGQGFIQPVPFSDTIFTLSVPQATQYEVIIRYQTNTPVDSISMTLYSSNGVRLDLNCDETPTPTNVTRFLVATLQPDQLFYTLFSVCLDNSVEYKLLLEYTSFSSVEWLLDSVVLLPAFSEISQYYQEQPLQDQVDIIEPCLPRAVPTELDLLCELPSFSLSTEFFEQVFSCNCDLSGATDDTCLAFGGSCVCQPGVTGQQCDRCLNGWFGFSTGGCQGCSCDSQGSTNPVCDQHSGQCDCLTGTTSRTCSECLPGFFNLTSTGCSACLCSEFALSEQCNDSGECSCPDGVSGLTCDTCLPGFYNISSEGCMQCQCDPFGSESEICNKETGECRCIGNSVGLNCDECPLGSFQTNGVSRELCVECVCSGKTDKCVVDEINYVLGSIQTEFTTLCTIAPTECTSGWRILTEDGQQAAPFGPSDSSGLGYILLLNHQPMLFAPDRFLGNRLGSYGQRFDIVVRVGESLDGTGILLVNTTIIRMVGSITGDVLVGVFPHPDIQEDEFSASRILSFSIPIMEEYWHVGDREGPTPTQLEFLSVLSDIGQLSVSADFTEDIIEFIHIVNVSLVSTFSTTELAIVDIVIITHSYPVEECLCPNGFSGSSCQDCARGYARLSQNIRDSCVQCDCNNQTLDCNVTTGVCLNCTGNTEGSNCERCISGYYGDPTRGISCLPCACPLIESSFSTTCFLDADNQQTCDSCEIGYTGRNCEVCTDGYFGNPMIGFCNDCQCNGNVDPALGPVCDTTTGRCMNCLNNTTGFSCDICLPGFFGDPTLPDQACRPCQCNPNGTMGDCDPLFGKCFCEPNVMGRLCDQCDDGYWGLSQGFGCIPCNCCSNGSVSTTCEQDTGACDCLPNVGSGVDDKCCTCSPGFFNFSSSTGCSVCQCSELATSNECELVTGACQCMEGAIGLKCDDCAFGFIGQVPNCERCHDCYFQWYEIIEDLTNRISTLRTTIDLLVMTYYNGYTLDTIREGLDRLVNILDAARNSLSDNPIQNSNITSLQESLAEVNATLNRYSVGVLDIQNALNISELYLNRANAFDGTVNMSDVTELQDLIYAYNSSISAIVGTANASFDMLTAIQVEVIGVWQELNNLESQVRLHIAQLAITENETVRVNQDLVDIQSRYNLLRANLSNLDSRGNQLLSELSTVITLLLNTSTELQSSNERLLTLKSKVNERLALVDVSSALAQQLNQTVRTALSAVMDAHSKTQQLLAQSENGLDQANETLSNVLSSLRTLDKIYDVLTASKNTSIDILGLSDLSEGRAVQLAEAINATILPEQLVEEIVQRASASHAIAVTALTNAQNALYSIMNVFVLVENLQQDLNCSHLQQDQLTRTLIKIQADITLVDSELQQTTSVSEELASSISETAEEIQTLQEQSIPSAQQLLSEGQVSLTSLGEQAQFLAEEISETRQALDTAVDTYRTDLQSLTVNTHNDSANTLSTVVSINQQAQNISINARRVSLQDLQDLLRLYLDESTQLVSLNNRVTALQQELAILTSSLVTTAETLSSCYKTP